MNKPTVVALFVGAGVVAVGTAAHLVRSDTSAPGMNKPVQAHADADGQLLWTCGMHPQVVQDHPGTCPICHMRLTPMHRGVGHDHGGPAAVVIDPVVVQNMGIRTAAVTRGPLTQVVRTVGTMEAPETGLHDISLRVGGWIQKLYANQEGQHVHPGDPLFDLYSPDLLAAGGELVGAVKGMAALGPTADPSIRRSAEEMVASAKRKLALLDVPNEQIEEIAKTLVVPTTFTFRSPVHGAVINKAVVEGSAVEAGQKLMRIEDHRTLWLDLQVYEDQMSLVAVGQAVAATVEGLPGRTFDGAVAFVHPHVDHMSRTVTVRATLQNLDGTLRPGMYASGTIRTSPVADAVQVPREAVIDTGTRQIAFVVLSDGHFQPRDVRMGITGDDGRVQVVYGLAVGDTVVTSGQFLLDVESRTTEAIDKLRAGSNADAPMPTTMPMPPAAPAEVTHMTAMPATHAVMLTVAYCPMKKAEWVQVGDTIANPYFGTSMSDCGEVRRHVDAPPEGSPLRAVADAYLKVEKALTADKLDADAVAALKTAANGLTDPAQRDVHDGAIGVTTAGNVDAARTALKTLSAALIRATEQPTTGPAGGRP